MGDKTVSNHYLSVLLKSLQRKGFDADDLLARYNLSVEQIHRELERVPYPALVSLTRYTWLKLNDENLGLSSKVLPLGGFRYASTLAIGADTIEQALELMFGFYNYLDAGVKVKYQLIDDEFEFQVFLESPDLPSYHVLSDFILAGFHRFFCWLIGRQIILKSASFDFPPPDYTSEYGLLYDCPKQFNSDKLSMRFSRDFLSCPIVKNSRDLDEYIASTPTDLLLNPVDDDSYSTRVKRFVESTQDHEFPNFSTVAEHLHMVPKTLRQHLKSEGITYQKIKDVMRRDLAIHYLFQPHYSIADIAEKIGFTETGAFIRAFKGWTNITPGNYRNQYIEHYKNN